MGFVLNTLRPGKNGRYFPDDIFECIFLKENVWIPIKISLKFVPKSQISNIPALVQKMAWRWPGDKPLSEPMMVRLLTRICVTRPRWVKVLGSKSIFGKEPLLFHMSSARLPEGQFENFRDIALILARSLSRATAILTGPKWRHIAT